MFNAISDTLSCLSLDGISFGIQMLHMNCKYSLPAIFKPYFGIRLHIFLSLKLISYPWILTIHHLCISLSIGISWIDCCIFRIGKMLMVIQENPIRIRLLLGLFFKYLHHRIQIIYPKISVELSSSQTRWVSGKIHGVFLVLW